MGLILKLSIMKYIFYFLFSVVFTVKHSYGQCDFFDDISVSSSGFHTGVGYSQNYILVSSNQGVPGNILGINTTGIFTSVSQGYYLIYAVNISGSLPLSLAIGEDWSTFVNTSGSLCKEISTPYLNREVYVCEINSACSPNQIQVSSSGYTATNTQTYVLCSTNPENIMAFNTTGTFVDSDYNNQVGVYTVYAVNTSASAVLNVIQDGEAFATIRDLESSECLKISIPKAFEVKVCVSPLPIELISFEAVKVNNEVKLLWQTLSELNNDYYTIERSVDLQNWEFITQVDGAGNSSTTLEYQTWDKMPLEGTSYYRLKQTDFNGEFSYSELKPIHFKIDNELNIFPNPTSGIVYIRSKKQVLKIEIYSILNQLIYSFNESEKVDLQSLANGNYIIKVITVDNEIEQQKIIVSK